MSEYQRTAMMQQHYGAHRESCPLRAMKGPELATGALEEFAQVFWASFSKNLLVLPQTPGTERMTMEQEAVLMHDGHSAFTKIVSLLRLKTAFWRQLPWSMAGLACVSEQRACAPQTHCCKTMQEGQNRMRM